MAIWKEEETMELFYRLCIGLSIGLMLGFIAGGIKMKFFRKTYSQEKIQFIQSILKALSHLLKYVTFLTLGLGFIWCVYFLAMGIFEPEQIDYANNMAELIVSVLTVISILFAFVEFLRPKKESD